jgi:spore maturation protein CgeB
VRVVIFCHSLVSDWNHGNAHFIRGVVSELTARGHAVDVYEPEDGWSRRNLMADYGSDPIRRFERAYPTLRSTTYGIGSLDVDAAIANADLVIVHEWTDHELVAAIGQAHTRRGRGVLLFHDSHHRSVTDPGAMSAYDLSAYDGVLAFGDAIRDRYLTSGWASRAWTWHEAADTRVFYPRSAVSAGDVVWIGNWGDEERTAELEEFLFTPVARLGLRTVLYGVRYPVAAQARLAAAGIEYHGWLPNFEVPEVFARFTLTVHVPRRPYLESLPGVPTIRPFEALACGTPLVAARWEQTGGHFEPGTDYLVARDGDEMTAHMSRLMSDADLRTRLSSAGRATVRARHTCAHRVDQLLEICADVRSELVLS